MNIKRELAKFEKEWAKFRPNDGFTPNGAKTYAWLGWWMAKQKSS